MNQLPKRKNPRAKWHNYKNGAYFITASTKNSQHYLGRIEQAQMHLSPLGKKLEEIILQTPEIRSNQYIDIPIYTIMPNHFHFILIFNDSLEPTIHRISEQPYSQTISSIIRGIKSSLTSYARQEGIEFAWHRSFYDRIIRNEREFHSIYEYIENNVMNWDLEKNHSIYNFYRELDIRAD